MSAKAFYPNSLCFARRDEVKLSSNFETSKFDSLFIAVEECHNKTRITKGKSPC